MKARWISRSARAAAGLALAGALILPGTLRAATPLTTEQVATGLSNPVFVTHAPRDYDRLFIVEQIGFVRILDLTVDPPVLVPTPFLDIDDRVDDTNSEQGLLGLAFHPNFANNRQLFVAYTDATDAVVISRFRVPLGSPDVANPDGEEILLTIDQPQTNHNGGWIAFGPKDGHLYIAIGDGGGSGDNDAGHTPGLGNGQDITDNLLGKILRIDVDGSNGPGGTYGIPASNPFVGVTGDDEIWAYGLRNPWRNSFDPRNGDLYIADVGQGDWEEVSWQAGSSTGGENWGWRCREGMHDFNNTGACLSATLLDPILEYAHGGFPFRCSITGGEVYRGCAVPDLGGTYFYADWCSAQIWSFVVSGGMVTQLAERTSELAPSGGQTLNQISSFGRDALGELYITDRGGQVYKVVPDGVADMCPAMVPSSSPESRTGLVFTLLFVVLALGAWPGVRRSLH